MTQGFYEPLEGKDENEKIKKKKWKQLFSCCVLYCFLQEKRPNFSTLPIWTLEELSRGSEALNVDEEKKHYCRDSREGG